jgi:hypothetical protein
MSVAVACRMRSGGALQFLVVNPAIPHNALHRSVLREVRAQMFSKSLENLSFGSLSGVGGWPQRKTRGSVRSRGKRAEQRAETVPHDLHPDAHQEK